MKNTVCTVALNAAHHVLTLPRHHRDTYLYRKTHTTMHPRLTCLFLLLTVV